ncbi:hypothetical protein FRX31_030287 [Thalictrum thalictroides]|uniref:Uncharacterized protein n=1 Tax=Thalictrum thalictroides TaxID=46969 RepID=A0A7J6V5D3_THATH|nr:hypothetical protein FRX31_030287 [Thalictrum thalictroides]
MSIPCCRMELCAMLWCLRDRQSYRVQKQPFEEPLTLLHKFQMADTRKIEQYKAEVQNTAGILGRNKGTVKKHFSLLRSQFGKLGEMIVAHPRLNDHSRFLFLFRVLMMQGHQQLCPSAPYLNI